MRSRKAEKKPVILIGMPACGKSTVGVLLAKRLGYRFVDSDLVIQEREERLLHEIISTEGTEGFIRIEEAVNCSLGTAADRWVIATGGSAVYSEAAMAHFKAIGTVVYLQLSYPTVRRRLGNYTHRGVVMPEGYTLRRLYDERCALYERYADITVTEEVNPATGRCKARNINDTLRLLCEALGCAETAEKEEISCRTTKEF